MSARAAVAQRIRDVGVIPVVRAASADEALRVADAIRAGGLPIVEITLTVPGALDAIERLAADHGEQLLVGAGSVLDAAGARACVAAGARFVVSPATDADLIAYCRERDVVAMPGALTPGEIVHAWRAGADFVKVFPVDALGGARYVRSLRAPLPAIALVPTGGVTLATAASFIEAGAAAIGVGSDLVDLDALRRRQPGRITTAARAYVEAVRQARGASACAAGRSSARRAGTGTGSRA